MTRAAPNRAEASDDLGQTKGSFMSDILPRRLVVLPGAVEREEGDKPTPEEAVGRVLAGNPHAPRLLSRARHKVVTARSTVATAHEAARACRDAEQDYDQIRREHDPNEGRNLYFWSAVAILAALAVVAGAIVMVMVWHIPLLDRIGLALGAVLLGASVAGGVSRRRNTGIHLRAAGLAMCLILVILAVLWSVGPLPIRLGEAVAFGIALAAGGTAAVLILDHAEGWCCHRKRRAYMMAVRRREDLVRQISHDDAAAEAAVNAWVSLVVEECQLGPAGDAGSTPWVEGCATAAHNVAIPG
jgi:hypothetical protein